MRWLAFAAGLLAACGSRSAEKIERDEDAGAGVVIVRRTTDGVRLEQEVEPNDEAAAAMHVPVPGGVTGTLNGAADVDRYGVKVETPGWLNVVVEGVPGVDLVIELVGADDKLLAHADSGPAEVSEGFPNYPVEPGEYAVVIREFTKKKRKPRKGESEPYTLTMKWQAEPTEARETEPNAAADKAKPVIIGGEVQGFVGWRADKDTWLIPVEGEYSVDIDIDPVEGVDLKATVSRGKKVLVTRSGARGQGLAVRGLLVGHGEEPLLLSITSRRSSFDEAYAIRVVLRELAFDAEAEPNDSAGAATALAVEPGSPAGARKGYLTPGDTDFFAIPVAPARQTLSVSVEPGSTTLDIAVSVVTDAGDVIAEVDAGGKGAAEKLEGAGIVANARTFLRVVRKPSKKHPDADDVAAAYTVRWSVVGDDVIPRELLE